MKNTTFNAGKNIQPVLWGVFHGLNDLAAGFMLAAYTYGNGYSKSFLFIVIYAVIGFGGQLPAGMLLDHKKQLKSFASLSVWLLPLAIVGYFINPEAGIILSGIASAFVHVTGGAVCLQVHENKSGPLGLFTAPGVLGLTAGSLLGQFGNVQLLPVLLLALVTGFLIMNRSLPAYKPAKEPVSEMDAHDWIMLSILLLMCFRSFIFDTVHQVAMAAPNGLLIIGISAFAGKLIGGFLADAIGWKKYVYISLPLAFLLLQFGKENIYALGFGIACLQSSVPITLLLMARNLPLYPATATGLSLGASVAIAGLPIYMFMDEGKLAKGFNDAYLTAFVFIFVVAFLVAMVWFHAKRQRSKVRNKVLS